MLRIFVNKEETVASVVEKIISVAESEVVLVIPKNSVLKESSTNFHLIKREADAVQKKVSIESVDDEILALAENNKLESVHPLFKDGSDSRSFSDIVVGDALKDKKETKKSFGVSFGSGIKKIQTIVSNPIAAEKPKSENKSEIRGEARVYPVISDKTADRPQNPWRRRLFILAVALAIIIIFSAWLTGALLGRAEVVINFKKTPWQYKGDFMADVKTAKINSESKLLPAELFVQPKNLTELFPASGKRNVSDKATGVITIYNEFSSQPQSLVATTRFEAPDGKIFRLDKSVTVPGAKISDGKVIPSSIDAAVTADKPGIEYNIGPIQKLSIPGFKGSPKYDVFYGELKLPAKGGFVGEKAVPTESEISAAKAKVTELLKLALEANVLNKLPADFKILEGASKIGIIKLSVNPATNDKGEFAVFGEAELKMLGFKELNLRSALTELSDKEYKDGSFSELKIDYSKIKIDFVKEQLVFSVDVSGVLQPAFNSDVFKQEISGKKVSEIKPVISGLRDLNDAKISFWPFWLLRSPKNMERIKIVIK